MKLDLSAESRGRVVVTTVVGSLFCVAVTVWADSYNFMRLSEADRMRAILMDVALPLSLAVPLLLFFSTKLRELAVAHHKLSVFASTDSLTQVMNRAAFTSLVEAYLREARPSADRVGGAMLIIDADNFKVVNDKFGHDRGDEALITIAASIKAMVRAPDVVGRLGGEEFGVFLHGADAEHARAVAERIRRNIRNVDFSPGGLRHDLTVSIGGAAFDRPPTYSELFRLADQQLYVAKRNGRDCVALAPAHPDALAA